MLTNVTTLVSKSDLKVYVERFFELLLLCWDETFEVIHW